MSGPPLTLPQEVLEIARTLEHAGYETWAVGGALRDSILGVPGGDFDLATSATPDQVQRLFPRSIPVGLQYGTVGVLDRNRVMHEVTTFRRDVKTDGRHAVVEFGVSLEDDLARRDFTINALAYHPERREWRDPFDGMLDADRKVLRAVGEPSRRFAEDYLRVLRALRFAARFNFTIDPPTWSAALAAAPGLQGLSAERVREEWFKGLETAASIHRLIELWRTSGAAAAWLPELSTGPGLLEPSPEPRDPVVLTAALCAGSAAVLTRLRSSNQEIGRARGLDKGPLEPAGDDPVAIRRWMARVGPAVDDLLLLARYRAGRMPGWGSVVEGVKQRGEAVTRAELAVTGEDLAASGIKPGPAMGKLLERLLDMVIETPDLNTREALLQKVREWT